VMIAEGILEKTIRPTIASGVPGGISPHSFNETNQD
jgi:hypothetical protein